MDKDKTQEINIPTRTVNINTIPIQYILPIREIANLPKDKQFTLLDIGAGVRDIKKFLPKNIQYFSLDCNDNINHNIKLDLNKGSDGYGHIPVKSNTFDIILCLETLEHLQNPQKTMKEILRISKDDAIIFLSMPNEYNFWLRLQYILGIKDDMKDPFQVVNHNLHIHLPRVKDIRTFFNDYLNIKKVYYGWNSYRAPRIFTKVLTKLARIWPSMFTRVVVIKGSKQ